MAKLFVHCRNVYRFCGKIRRVVQNDILAPISFVDSDLGQIDVVGATAFGFDEVTQFLPEVTGIARDSGDSDGIFKRVIIDDSLLTLVAQVLLIFKNNMKHYVPQN